MSKKNRNQRRQPRRNSPLSAHKRHKNKLTPPLMNIAGGAMKAVRWEQDDLPDFLVIINYLSEHGEPAAVDRFHQLLNVFDLMLGDSRSEPTIARTPGHGGVDTQPGNPAVDSIAATAGTTEEDGVTDATAVSESAADFEDLPATPDVQIFVGRLTDFAQVDEAQRAEFLVALVDEGIYEDLIPENLAHVLGMYPEAPGSWLLQPWFDRGLSIDPEKAERTLNRLLVEAGPRQGSLATWAKALFCRRYLAAGRTHLPSKEMWNLYTGWPYHDEEDDNRHAESGYRAMYSALSSFDQAPLSARREWARIFWRSNWKIYACHWPTDDFLADLAAADIGKQSNGAPAEPGEEPNAGGPERSSAASWRETLVLARETVEGLRADFHQLAETTDPDLYSPDRYEVLTGLVGRVLRYLGVFSGYPPLWTMEHGAPLLRTLIETRIVFRYIVQSDDVEVFSRFKAYGMGKLKLLKLHYEDVIDKTEVPSDELLAYVEYLDSLVNQDTMEEFQDIDLGGNFAGADTRKMALAVGLEDAYRLVFAPASANVHGEWSIMDEYVFDRCENPAHRRHRILRRTRYSAVGPNFLQILIDHAAELVAEYETATATSRKLG